MKRVRIVSVDGETMDLPCRLDLEPGKDGHIVVNATFNRARGGKGKRACASPFGTSPSSSGAYWPVDDFARSKALITSDEFAQLSDYDSIWALRNILGTYVRNTYDRDNIIYDFLKEHCDSKPIHIGEKEFLLVGNLMLCQASYVDDDDDTREDVDPSKMNLDVVYSGNRKKGVFYEKNLGPILLPDNWDVEPSGNSAITRRIKKHGPTWRVVSFELIKSTGKTVPKTIGYAAHIDHICEAKQYFAKNRKRLQREKVYRKIDKISSYVANEDSKKALKSFFKKIQDKT